MALCTAGNATPGRKPWSIGLHGNQTCLPGKSPINPGFIRKITDIYMDINDHFSSMFDYQRVSAGLQTPVKSIDSGVYQMTEIQYNP